MTFLLAASKKLHTFVRRLIVPFATLILGDLGGNIANLSIKAKRVSNHPFVLKNICSYPSKSCIYRLNSRNIKIIPTETIHYIEAQDDYVMIYANEGRFLKQQTMKYYENCLDSKLFIRIHRSYIIKIDQIKQIEPYEKDSYIVKTASGAKLSVSKAGYKKLKDILNF